MLSSISRPVALGLSLLLLLFTIDTPALATQAEDERLAVFFEEVFERDLAQSPSFQSQLGIKGPGYGTWDDASDAHAQRLNQQAEADLARLRSEFDFATLSAQSRVSYRLFEFAQQSALKQFPWRFHRYGFSTTNNPAADAVTFLQNVHRIDDVSDAEAYISRITGMQQYMAQIGARIDTAAARGIVPTSFSFDPIINDSRSLISGAPFDDSSTDSALLADFRAKLDKLQISAADKSRLLESALAALKGPFKTAITAFINQAESLRGKSVGPVGVWKLADGKAFYQSQIEFFTTDTTLTPQRIHAIGLDEVARIRGEMQALMQRIGFKGDLPAFFHYLRTDPSNFYPNTDAGREAYLDQSRAYIDAVYTDAHQYFNLLPKAPLDVRRVEPWREKTASRAFYSRPSPDGARPGIYYVNLVNMASMQKHEMETLAYHEGAPGHHFQIAIQQELTDVPKFQQFLYFGAYTEGWGLYAERLAKETGHFSDPMQDFGRLQDEMLRAVRLVVDSGCHSLKWSREKMIDYMLANSPMTEEEATREVERYINWPGQALSYKIGMLKILELREMARHQLGKNFDIRAFHDTVLHNGAVPLPVLEQLVDAYIAQVQKQ